MRFVFHIFGMCDCVRFFFAGVCPLYGPWFFFVGCCFVDDAQRELLFKFDSMYTAHFCASLLTVATRARCNSLRHTAEAQENVKVLSYARRIPASKPQSTTTRAHAHGHARSTTTESVSDYGRKCVCTTNYTPPVRLYIIACIL